jgi:MFS family permease
VLLSGDAAPPSRRLRLALPRMLRALAHRDYRLWALADLISTVGSWMQLIAQNWMVLQLTHSPAQLGITVAVQSAPTLVLGMWGGNLVDRLPRRPLLIATQAFFAVLALVLAGTTAIGALNIWVIWTTALLTGLATTVNTPAVGALCAEMVPVEDLGNAIALGAATSSTGRMLGLACAGWVVAACGAQTAFAFNALSFVAVIVALLRMRTKFSARRVDKNESDGALRGLRYITRSRNLLGLLALCFVLSSFGRNFQVTMAAMVDGPLHGGAEAYGVLSTVFAVGTVVGAVVAARSRSLNVKTLLVAGGGAAALQSLSSIAPTTMAFACTMAPIAVGAVVVDTASGYLVQTRSDPAFRGRVLAAAALVSAAAGAAGGPILGWIAGSFGARASLAVGGVVALVAVLGCALVRDNSALRRLDRFTTRVARPHRERRVVAPRHRTQPAARLRRHVRNRSSKGTDHQPWLRYRGGEGPWTSRRRPATSDPSARARLDFTDRGPRSSQPAP